jgi:hypothetical protein
MIDDPVSAWPSAVRDFSKQLAFLDPGISAMVADTEENKPKVVKAELIVNAIHLPEESFGRVLRLRRPDSET